MPKKKKTKSKVRKKVSRKTKSKVRKKVSKNSEEKELIFKTRPEWVKSALINKTKYQKNILTPLKTIMNFGKKREKE